MNILVDSKDTPRIAGLGSVRLESSPATWSEDSHGLTRCSAPELVNPEAFRPPRPHTTKASDVYAFGVLVYQVKHMPTRFQTLDSKLVTGFFGQSNFPQPER